MSLLSNDFTTSDTISTLLTNIIIVVVGIVWACKVRREGIITREVFQTDFVVKTTEHMREKRRRARSLMRMEMQDEAAVLGNMSTSGGGFAVGDRVRVVKEARTKGKTAVVTQPQWNGLVK